MTTNKKSVFITGAARGIGLATAQEFARQGFVVGLFDIDAHEIKQALARPEFADACGGVCDVSNEQSVMHALALFSEHCGGKMDVLVNNAGVLFGGEFEMLSADQIDKMIAVNVGGLTRVAHAAFPLLKSTSHARMINLCSASSVYGFPILAVYSATKFYVRGLTEALNIEWAKHDIHVCSIKPPYVETAMLNDVPDEAKSKVAAEFNPEDIARIVFRAANSNKVALLVGSKIKLWDFLVRLFPESIGKQLTKYLSGYTS